MDEAPFIVAIVAILALFVGLPWLIFHYVTQWKKNGTLSVEDENLLDELHALARRLDDRMNTIERIVAADSPSFRPDLRDERNAIEEDFELSRSSERPTRTRRREH
ncbi:envelope stress response membrane protein PspB [Sphingomonas sp. ASY06-1R]|jgi:phage shock protein B|uniref:envelope stress response membrane protein PspB n=1 Tax=Sphingomonas sp. ASY06-1R TaxID=3445771 RepID=UPI003FA2D2A1